MREMKNSGVEWIGDIPSDWEIHRVKNHYSIVSGSGFKPDLQGKLSGDYPVCKASDISSAEKDLFFAANYITVDIANREGFSVIPSGSIIFAKIGEAMRKNNRSICRVDCCADNNCQGLVPNNIDVDYGYYLFNCIDMKWFDNAGTVPCINNQKLKDCGIPFPNIIEQKKISHFLDEKCAEIDTVIEKTKATIEEYKKLKQSVITQAVTKGIRPNRPMKDSGIEWIGEIPVDWETKKLKFVADFIQTKYSSDYGALNYIGLENIVSWNGSFIKTDSEYDREQSLICDCNDILFGKLRPYLAKVHISEKLQCCSGEFSVIRIKENNTRFLWYQLISHGFIFMVDRSTYGTKMPRANSDYIKNMEISIPSIEEQQEIAEYLDKKCSEIDELIAKKTSLLSELESYKKSLIYEYVTGKKEV